MPSILTIGRTFLTLARLADAGVSVLQVGDELWVLVDPDSRHPELRTLTTELSGHATVYDGKLETLIKKSNDLTNLSHGLHVLNSTIQLMDDKGVALFARYEKLEKYRESFTLKFPTLRNWFNESWIRKHNLDPKSYTHLTSRPDRSAMDIVMQAGVVGFGVGMTYFKVKGLVSMGYNAYLHRTGQVPTRPRANAFVAPTGRYARFQHRFTMLTVRYPRIYETLRGGATLASLGLNLYLFVNKIKVAESQEAELRKQIGEMKASIRYMDLFSTGTKNDQDLMDLKKEYKLEVDEQHAEELRKGIFGLLSDYNGNLADCMHFIDETFAQLEGDADIVSVDDKAQQAIRDDRAACHALIAAIQATDNGEVRKAEIMKLNDFARKALVARFDEWAAALDSLLEIENIRAMIAQEALSLYDDLVDLGVPESKWPERIVRQAKRTFSSVNAVLPNRKVFLKEEDVLMLLQHFFEEQAKHPQAA
ncbi:MAG TPA: hypothetical protein DIT18_15150 [Pseudomonas sp.]|nr:hypothetical protein [Pseudomonas sp.]